MPAYFITFVWLGLAVSFVVLEGLNLSMVNLRYAIGAAAAALVSVFTPVALIQTAVFLAISAILAAKIRPREGVARFVGHTAKVLDAADQGQPGQVRVGRNILQARSSTRLDVGASVRVVSAQDGIVTVAPIRTDPAPGAAA